MSDRLEMSRPQWRKGSPDDVSSFKLLASPALAQTHHARCHGGSGAEKKPDFGQMRENRYQLVLHGALLQNKCSSCDSANPLAVCPPLLGRVTLIKIVHTGDPTLMKYETFRRDVGSNTKMLSSAVNKACSYRTQPRGCDGLPTIRFIPPLSAISANHLL
ncbi:MAG TPA: hypothetical protein VHS31_01935 [Tepidisphaeraceae bacterium]|nr:hypothetical protein [Tepidisphaeraceae bacterium]